MVVTTQPSAWTASIVQLLHGLTIHMDRASAALAGIAADVGTGEPQVLAQQLDEQAARLHLDGPAVPH